MAHFFVAIQIAFDDVGMIVIDEILEHERFLTTHSKRTEFRSGFVMDDQNDVSVLGVRGEGKRFT